ncbi:hypothetical protein RKD30_006737 [Streptomyces pristinaespiralis]
MGRTLLRGGTGQGGPEQGRAARADRASGDCHPWLRMLGAGQPVRLSDEPLGPVQPQAGAENRLAVL